MVLEETLTLNGTDDVQAITRLLRDAGIAVRTNRTTELKRISTVTGTIRGFRELFTREIRQIQEQGSDQI